MIGVARFDSNNSAIIDLAAECLSKIGNNTLPRRTFRKGVTMKARSK
jgi:hypothetical protein